MPRKHDPALDYDVSYLCNGNDHHWNFRYIKNGKESVDKKCFCGKKRFKKCKKTRPWKFNYHKVNLGR